MEAFGVDEPTASEFLQKREVAAEVTALLDGTGPNTLYVYYQPRDIRLEVCEVAWLSAWFPLGWRRGPGWEWVGGVGVRPPGHPLCPLRLHSPPPPPSYKPTLTSRPATPAGQAPMPPSSLNGP